jgi:NAD(P)-dependent dehydrogenase (short-subunit alcohol dehydrogenase family)
VITGGSSGIGAATVRRFVAEGAEVLIADIAIDEANAFAHEMGAAVTSDSSRTSHLIADTASPISSARAFASSIAISAIRISAPSATNRRTVAAPMPLEPPVITQVIPFSRIGNTSKIFR